MPNDTNIPSTNIGRRRFIEFAGALALFSLGNTGCQSLAARDSPGSALSNIDTQISELERRVFDFFWETTDPATGLAPDRWPTPSFSSISAIGFALTAYPIGVERGYITREQAAVRVMNTLRFLRDAPQGPEPMGNAGYKGFFYHFLDMKTGTRFAKDVELSSIDTALLLAGVLYCQSYFTSNNNAEAEIRAAADTLYGRVDWRWFQPRPPAISLGWSPETGFNSLDWKGYTEAMPMYLLALGSPTHAVDADAWLAWTSTYETSPVSGWVSEYGQTYLRFPPLFGHQFPHCWVDFRGIQDSYMRGKGIDYFENSRRAIYAQQAYAIANPEGWAGYGKDIWGVTASDGPADVQRNFGGRQRRFISYAGRGMGGASTYDDGTIAPYGAGSSIALAPEIAVPALTAMRGQLGMHIYDRYGFHAFNRSFTFTDIKLQHGRVVPGFGWVDTDYLGIEQGPLLAMLGNYRGELVWKTMRNNAYLKRGLQRAGFRGGWLG